MIFIYSQSVLEFLFFRGCKLSTWGWGKGGMAHNHISHNRTGQKIPLQRRFGNVLHRLGTVVHCSVGMIICKVVDGCYQLPVENGGFLLCHNKKFT